jgi:DNA-binding GntR family transcriptional regulator
MATKETGGTIDMPDSAFDGVTRITRVTLHDAALNQIRDMIIEGKLAPGMRINEGQVGAMLGVSRTPLREAIKSLVGEGLVEILPAKGAVVRRFSIGDIRDILEVIKALEQSAAQLACERASDAEIKAIVALHEEMLELYRNRNRLAYFKLNQAIHSALVRASGNPVLAETHEQLQARIKRIRFIGNETPDRWAGAVADHEAMIEALRRRDAPALVEAVGLHLDRTLDRVRDTVV